MVENVHRKVLGCGGSLMMVEVHFEEGGVAPVHSHKHQQVSYVVKGSFEVTIGQEKTKVKQGDSFYAEGHKEHGVKALVDVFTPIREDFLE